MPGLRCCPCKPGVFAMGPKPPTASDNADLFRSRLENLLDHQHALYRLAGLIDWSQFDHAFGRFYRPLGRPAKPTRLMVGLSGSVAGFRTGPCSRRRSVLTRRTAGKHG